MSVPPQSKRTHARGIARGYRRAPLSAASVHDHDPGDLALLDDFSLSVLGEIANPFGLRPDADGLIAGKAEVRAGIARAATTAGDLAREGQLGHFGRRQRRADAAQEARER